MLLFFSAPNSMERFYMLVCILIVFTQIIIFFAFGSKRKSYKLKKIYLRHMPIFVMCFVVVFFQNDIDYILGLKDGSENNIWIDSTVVCKALLLSAMSLTSILIGYRLMQRYEKSRLKVKEAKYDYFSKGKNQLCLLGYFMLAFYLLFAPKEYLQGGYGTGVERGDANVILVLLQAVILAMFSLYCYDFKKKGKIDNYVKELAFPLTLVFLYMSVVLITGRRTEAIRMGILLVITYSYAMGTRSSNKLILTYLFVGVVLFSIIGVVRSGGGSGMSEGFKTVADKASVMPFTSELAGSVNTLHVAVSYFPDVINYSYGITFFPNYLVLVPGLERLYRTQLKSANLVTHSEDIITNLHLGDNASYGMGSSIVADVYIAFGPIGIVLVFVLFGIFLRYLEIGTFCMIKSPYFLVLSFGCCSQFMFACRGTIAIMFLSWSYATILVYLLSKRKINVKSV